MSETLSSERIKWKEYQIGDLIKLEYGKSLTGYRDGGAKYDVYGTNGKIGTTNTFLHDQMSLIIGRKGAYREVHLSNGPFFVIDTAFYTKKLNDLSDTLFIYYWFKNVDINSMDSGSAIPSTSRDEVYELKILLPPLPEQKVIAEVLSSLDDKIDLLHRQNKTLEQMAETLFRKWFVEEIRKIEFESTQIEGFTMNKFTKWIDGTIGGEWGKEKPTGDFIKPVYCIRGTDIADLNVGIPQKTPVRYVKENKFDKIKASEGDLIIEISGGTETQSTGRVTYINQDIETLFNLPLVFSNFCRMIKVKRQEYSFFIYCYIQYLYNQDEFFNLENGSSGIKNLDYKALLLELEYPMPSEELVLKFHKVVRPFFKKINKNKSQIRNLTALRDTLLPKLMSGEIRVQ